MGSVDDYIDGWPAFAGELEQYQIDKGTIRFPLERLAKFRAKEARPR